MIIVAKSTLALLWLVAFILTCLVLAVSFPIVVLAEKVSEIPKGFFR